MSFFIRRKDFRKSSTSLAPEDVHLCIFSLKDAHDQETRIILGFKKGNAILINGKNLLPAT
ncbi:hypothetical protein MCU_01127 [Bartonella elizabethae Re6043vi]|uniref:Uncharacterized protein n=2 Tax=Bartonella elizabethae TaxID=807 RepID=J1KHE7_BAREL|nr:hypothetical protein MCU_01127 [Bartonella elizabethae Re6043vi]EJF97010.1 hypothetical protein MEE_00188 [Bartonella elizabethae F9251 = ATCC 49927]VEJ42179.1 Uncharacterised protein [Bartonella elizabethae]